MKKLLVMTVLMAGLVPTPQALATAGDRIWIKGYNGFDGIDEATAITVSPDGTRVFVSGGSYSYTSVYDYGTIAYDAATGTKLWIRRFDGHSNDIAFGTAVSPDGTKLFVTGASQRGSGDYSSVTIAYDASDGRKIWVGRYRGLGYSYSTAIAVSPNGDEVFVTGITALSTTGFDYATVAFDASTGDTIWTRRYIGTGGEDNATALAVSPDGSKVFVTGDSEGSSSGPDYATIAYDAFTGATIWIRRLNGPANSSDYATALASTPDGSKVIVTGRVIASTTGFDYATIAYDSSTGAKVWMTRYKGGSGSDDIGGALSVSPDGRAVYVTGYRRISSSDWDWATVGYDVASGSELWARSEGGPGGDKAVGVAVSPDSQTVYVAGRKWSSATGYDFVTTAYGATSGATLWSDSYNRGGNATDEAMAIAANPAGNAIYATGAGWGPTSIDYLTIAYAA